MLAEDNNKYKLHSFKCRNGISREILDLCVWYASFGNFSSSFLLLSMCERLCQCTNKYGLDIRKKKRASEAIESFSLECQSVAHTVFSHFFPLIFYWAKTSMGTPTILANYLFRYFFIAPDPILLWCVFVFPHAVHCCRFHSLLHGHTLSVSASIHRQCRFDRPFHGYTSLLFACAPNTHNGEKSFQFNCNIVGILAICFI